MTRLLICTDLVTNVFLKIEKLHIYFVLEEFRFPKKWESYSMLFLWSGYSVPQSVQSKLWICSDVFVLSKNLSERSIILLWESLRSSGVKIQCCYKGFCLKKNYKCMIIITRIERIVDSHSSKSNCRQKMLYRSHTSVPCYLGLFEWIPFCLVKNC